MGELKNDIQYTRKCSSAFSPHLFSRCDVRNKNNGRQFNFGFLDVCRKMDLEDLDGANVAHPRNVENIRNLMLTNAIKAGNLDSVIQALRDYNIGVDEPIDGGWPAFLVAASNCQFNIMVHFLNLGADPLVADNFFNALMAVCLSSCSDEEMVLRCVRLLLNQGLPVNEKDQQRTTALMMAANKGHKEAVSELIARNANLDLQDYEGWSAIFHAASQNHVDVVKLLIENRASVNLVDRRGRKLIEIAEIKGFSEIVDLITECNKEVIIEEEPDMQVNLAVRNYKDMLTELPGENEFMTDVFAFLHTLDLDRYTRAFYNEKVNLGNLMVMKDLNLKEVGVLFSAHRKLMLSSIKKFHLSQWRNCFGLNVEDKLYSDLFVFFLANITRHLYSLTHSIIFIEKNCPKAEYKRFSSDFKDIILKSVDQLEIIESCIKRMNFFGKKLQKYDRIKYVDLISEESFVIENKKPNKFVLIASSLSVLLTLFIVRRRIF